MRSKVWFLSGLAAGFVIGTQVRHECYEKMLETTRKVKDSPRVQEAAGTIQNQVSRLRDDAKRLVVSRCSSEGASDEQEKAESAAEPPGPWSGSPSPTGEAAIIPDEPPAKE
ncbi:MAG: hypothetical protein JXA67_13915 [Micromonosporaceae bacterium]|nr:hypothetical protein [Micromonosporaceae bacterium]